MQTNPSTLCTQENNFTISTNGHVESLKQQQLEQHRQRLASHVQFNPVVTSIQQSSSQIPVQNLNDPSKQHHLMHTNHLAINKQQNSLQSAVHMHNDSSRQHFRQHLPSYMQINPIVARSQQNCFQLPVQSQQLNHMQTCCTKLTDEQGPEIKRGPIRFL